ncbi:MAG: selenocysteine-specific translation elongation factor [Massilia sp.]|nr:selenocysteine-specific translation elongation factor [Massilia sp.]
MIIGTAGHIDHGKTALVRALTGVETDRLKEEKARGITIELGYAYQAIDPAVPDGPRLGFVDMPGHERFIQTMLAGASGIRFAMLIVAADDGVMPQTIEHLHILQLLGMRQGAIVITKIDLVDRARIEQLQGELETLLAPTFLYAAPVFFVSSISGDGVPQLKAHLLAAASQWHRQNDQPAPLQEHQQDARQDPLQGRHASLFRLAVDRCFSIDGRGTIVTGTVHAGALQVGETVTLLPSSRGGRMLSARVRSMHALDQAVPRCSSGQRVSLNLVGLERSEIARGDWVVAETISHVSERIAIDLALLPGSRVLKHWSEVQVHVGTAHATAHVALLEGDQVAPGGSMLAELALEVPLHVCHGDRIVLRDASGTIGGGSVLDAFVPLRGKRALHRLALLGAQREHLLAQTLKTILELEPRGINLAPFAANRNLDAAVTLTLLAQLDTCNFKTREGHYACASAHWHTMQQLIVQNLEKFHASEPDNAGVERERLRRQSLPTLSAEVFAQLIASLIDEGRVLMLHNVFVALPAHSVLFSESEQALWERIVPLLSEQPFQPPRVRPLALTLGLEEEQMRKLLSKSARLGQTYRVAHDHYFLSDSVSALATHITAIAEVNGNATVALLRDRIGTGRKLAVEILEFFDRMGFCRRIHDRHLIRPSCIWLQSA